MSRIPLAISVEFRSLDTGSLSTSACAWWSTAGGWWDHPGGEENERVKAKHVAFVYFYLCIIYYSFCSLPRLLEILFSPMYSTLMNMTELQPNWKPQIICFYIKEQFYVSRERRNGVSKYWLCQAKVYHCVYEIRTYSLIWVS